jgi:signal transduction histidine kinase
MLRISDPGHRPLPARAERGAGPRHEEVARACHELRGSLTVVRLGLSGGAATLSQERLRAIELELEKATLALDDLAGVDATIRRPACPAMRPVDLRALLDDTLEAWRGAAECRGVRLSRRCPLPAARDEGVLLVEGDRLRLAQAVGNLLANAIEHGGGPVEARLRVEGSWVRIEVTDGGSGLPAPVEELIRRPRHSRGMRGHGLAITAAIASAHGGRVAAAPSDRGARLVLELPRRAGASA